MGGESTRPGAEPVSAAEEAARVVPVIEKLVAAGAVISIDTMKAEVAAQAVQAGAEIINDVTSLADPDMARVAAETGAALVLMHMKGTPRNMQKDPVYDDVLAEVCVYLEAKAEKAVAAGVSRQKIILDPGIGFGKNLEHNLTLLKGLPKICGLGYPVLLGASRKAMLGKLTGGKPADRRLYATIGVHVAGAMLGAGIVRVHEVEPVKEALAISDAIQNLEDV